MKGANYNAMMAGKNQKGAFAEANSYNLRGRATEHTHPKKGKQRAVNLRITYKGADAEAHIQNIRDEADNKTTHGGQS